jgi:hypothetical protein
MTACRTLYVAVSPYARSRENTSVTLLGTKTHQAPNRRLEQHNTQQATNPGSQQAPTGITAKVARPRM